MTDRYMGFTVVLDNDYRSDDAQAIIDAIKMIKGVAKVTPEVTDGHDYMNRTMIAMKIEERIFKALHDDPSKAKK